MTSYFGVTNQLVDEAASRWVDRGYAQGYNDRDRVTNVDSIGCTGMHVTGFFLAVAPF